MAIYKNISAKYIIAKIHRDIGLEDLNYTADIVEWIGEALEFIGTAVQLERKQTTIVVESHKAELPEDFVELIQLRYKSENSGWIFPKYNPTSFNPHKLNNENWKSQIAETYSLTPNYIMLDFEDGEVDISYLGMPVDEDGFPLVPDNQYFREALMWYCFHKLLLRGYIPKGRDINFEFAQHQWKFYCTAARNKANYPDIGQYQRFADVWVGLIPPQRLFDKGFNLEDPVEMATERIDASNIVTKPLEVAKKTKIDGGDSQGP